MTIHTHTHTRTHTHSLTHTHKPTHAHKQALVDGSLDRASLERLLAQSAAHSDDEGVQRDAEDALRSRNGGDDTWDDDSPEGDDDVDDDDDDHAGPMDRRRGGDLGERSRRQNGRSVREGTDRHGMDDDDDDHHDEDGYDGNYHDDEDEHGAVGMLSRTRRSQTQNARGDVAASRVVDDPLVMAAFARGNDEAPAERAGLKGQVRESNAHEKGDDDDGHVMCMFVRAGVCERLFCVITT